MIMQTDLFHGPRYWSAAYRRRWQKMISSSANVFCGTAFLLLGLVLLDPSPLGYLVVVYWLLSLQVCYDDHLNSRVYQAWGLVGIMLMAVSWSTLSPEPLFVIIQAAPIAVSAFWAYTSRQRECWRDWWARFTFWEFDPDNNRSLTTEELCIKFGLGRKLKDRPNTYQVNKFLRTLQDQGYVKPHRSVAYPRTTTWLELNIGNSHLVDFFLLRGVIPPPINWLHDYITKHDPQHELLIREPA